MVAKRRLAKTNTKAPGMGFGVASKGNKEGF
jgi:hypothetical protein